MVMLADVITAKIIYDVFRRQLVGAGTSGLTVYCCKTAFRRQLTVDMLSSGIAMLNSTAWGQWSEGVREMAVECDGVCGGVWQAWQG